MGERYKPSLPLLLVSTTPRTVRKWISFTCPCCLLVQKYWGLLVSCLNCTYTLYRVTKTTTTKQRRPYGNQNECLVGASYLPNPSWDEGPARRRRCYWPTTLCYRSFRGNSDGGWRPRTRRTTWYYCRDSGKYYETWGRWRCGSCSVNASDKRGGSGTPCSQTANSDPRDRVW